MRETFSNLVKLRREESRHFTHNWSHTEVWLLRTLFLFTCYVKQCYQQGRPKYPHLCWYLCWRNSYPRFRFQQKLSLFTFRFGKFLPVQWAVARQGNVNTDRKGRILRDCLAMYQRDSQYVESWNFPVKIFALNTFLRSWHEFVLQHMLGSNRHCDGRCDTSPFRKPQNKVERPRQMLVRRFCKMGGRLSTRFYDRKGSWNQRGIFDGQIYLRRRSRLWNYKSHALVYLPTHLFTFSRICLSSQAHIYVPIAWIKPYFNLL